MAEFDGEKSHDPTPQRRQRARQEGHVARSQDLSSAGLLLGGLVVILFTGGTLLEFLAQLLTSYLGGQGWMASLGASGDAGRDAVTTQWSTLIGGLSRALLPLVALITLLSIVVNIAQTGFLFLPDKLVPDFSRLNPLAGLGRIVSPRGGARLGFGITKIVVIVAVAGGCLYQQRERLLTLGALDLPQIAAFVWEICVWTCVKIGLALLLLAAGDYAYQRWRHEQDLKMTPQEVREELRNMQGDPQIAARRRNVQQQLAVSRLAEGVPRADVVVADSRGIAVALRFDSDSMPAPVVVSRGVGQIGQRVRRIAVESGVPVVERDLLAQELYDDVPLNAPIPDRLYARVAEVLAFAYQLRNKAIPKAA